MQRLRECSDEELLSRVVADDRAAFDALVERYAPRVLGVCLHVLHHQQDAADACQDAFLLLWRKAASIQDRRKLQSWLHRVAHHEALRIREAKQREKREYLSDKDDQAQLAQPIDEVELHEMQILVREEVQHLPQIYRVSLVLHYLEDKSKAEIAAELDRPEGTISNRLARGRELLRRRLAHYGFLAPD